MKILDIPRSGSYHGITSSHNRAGQYVRNRRAPTQAPTARRTLIRSAFGAGSSGWSTITDAERAAWVAAADSHPITDRLGQAIKLTGHQLFVSINTQLTNCAASNVVVPPSDFSVFTLAGSTIVFGLVAGVTWTFPGLGASADFILESFSRPVPAGRSFWNTFSQLGSDSGDSTGGTATTAAYSAVFGTPAVGQKVFGKFTPVSSLGVTGVAVVVSAIVTA